MRSTAKRFMARRYRSSPIGVGRPRNLARKRSRGLKFSQVDVRAHSLCIFFAVSCRISTRSPKPTPASGFARGSEIVECSHSDCLVLFVRSATAARRTSGKNSHDSQKHPPHTLRNNYALLPCSSPTWRYRPTEGRFSDSPRTLQNSPLGGSATPDNACFLVRRYRPEDPEEASLHSSTSTLNSPRDQPLSRASED